MKIVAITASVFDEDHLALTEAGCDGLVYKPINEQYMFSIMGELLGLSYRYGEPILSKSPLPFTEPDLSPISTELLSNLKFAAETLDYSVMQGLVMQIGETWPEIAAALNDILQEFQLEHIAKLCILAEETLKNKVDGNT